MVEKEPQAKPKAKKPRRYKGRVIPPKPTSKPTVDPQKRGPKATKLQVEQRRADIEALMALSVPPTEIWAKMAQKHGVSERQIRHDMAAVYKRWDDESAKERPRRRLQMRHMLRRIIRSAMASGQHGAAVAAARTIMELDGLRTINVEHSGKVEHTVEAMTSDEKRKRMAELIERANGRPVIEVQCSETPNGTNGANGRPNGANGQEPDVDYD